MISKNLILFMLLLCLCGLTFGNNCVMRGNCGVSPTTGQTRVCVYDGPPLSPVTDEFSDILGVLENRCPGYFYDEEGNRLPDDQVLTCCAFDQILSLDSSLLMAEQVLQRCPTCYSNFVRYTCDMACSRDQSRYSFVEEAGLTGIDDQEYVLELRLRLNEEFMEGAYESCKGVFMPQGGTLALDAMCGIHGAANCDPFKMFYFIGDTSANQFAPFHVHLESSNDVAVALSPPSLPCNEAFPDSIACSCLDCAESCPTDFVAFVPEPPCKVFDVNCVSFSIAITVFVIPFIIFVTLTIVDRRIGGSRETKTGNLTDNKRDWTRILVVGSINKMFEWIFSKIGVFAAMNPILILMITSWIGIFIIYGTTNLQIMSKPLELWSSPTSQSRQELDFFNTRFTPFYRTAQVFFRVQGLDNLVHDTASGELTFGPAFQREVLREVIYVQKQIMALGQDTNGGMEHICFAPLRVFDDEILLNQCSIMSFFEYFGNDLDTFEASTVNAQGFEINYLNTLVTCLNNAFNPNCLAQWGGPIFPNTAFGGFFDGNIFEADTVILSFPIANHVNEEDLGPALEWESKFLEYLHDYEAGHKPEYIELSFAAERSIEDEIGRVAISEAVTVAISYVFMFIYVTLALGKVFPLKSIFIDSKVSVAVAGIGIVIVSIACSLGFFGYIGIPTSLLAINILPFFLLSVGVDNIFIMVNTFEDLKVTMHEETFNLPFEKRKELLFRKTMAKIGPSMIVTVSAQIVCFAVGSISNSPAVESFGLFAAVALAFLLLFQFTTSVAILALDYRRTQNNRFDVLCCIRKKMSDDSEALSDPSKSKSLIRIFVGHYAKYLLTWQVKIVVVILFLGWLAASITFIPHLSIGIDQEAALPDDSYVVRYLLAVATLFQNGPPVYFVLTAGLNFTDHDTQSAICGGQMCNSDSVVTQIFAASLDSDITYIQQGSNSWMDDYFTWSSGGSCCRTHLDGTFCSHTNTTCQNCEIELGDFGVRPWPEMFSRFIPFFLSDNPTMACTTAGQASYSDALNYITDDDGLSHIEETHYMSFHTPLTTSSDYIGALQYARLIAENITEMLKKETGLEDIECFPYSIFYVFYEQYLTMWEDTTRLIGFALLAVLGIILLITGFDIFSTFVIMLTVIMILLNMMGLMYFWNIELNAVSLINLLTCIGIAVEFCSHTVYAYRTSEAPLRERAHDALSTMGANVISGITLTNIPIVVLAFASTQLFEIYFFRMFFGIVLISFAHGLIFLPVMLSFMSDVLSY